MSTGRFTDEHFEALKQLYGQDPHFESTTDSASAFLEHSEKLRAITYVSIGDPNTAPTLGMPGFTEGIVAKVVLV